MNKPNITEGPWRLKSSNKTASLEIVGGDKYHHVCIADGKRAASHFKAEQANVRAIAAVPELLKALEDALPLLFHTANAQRRTALDEQQAQAAWNQAKAALEKAGYTF